MSVPSKAGGAIPLAGICCLGLMCFLIASTVILALIPLYVPSKSVTVVTPADDANTFQLQYTSSGLDRANTASGQLDNVNSVSNALNLGSGATVSEGHAKASYATATTRRRRNLLVRRRRAVVGTMQINLKCRYTTGIGCQGACAERSKALVKQTLSSTRTISFGMAIRYAGRVLNSPGFRCNYDGLQDTPTRPKGYNSVDSLDFVASKSGDINDPDTWQNGVVPFNGCGVTVSAGVSLILSGTSLAIPLASLRVAPGATLTLGSPGQAGFVFEIALAMVISGTMSFQGSGGALILPAGSNLAFSETAVYAGAAIAIQTITASGQIITITSVSSDSIPTSIVISPDGVPSVVTAANTTTAAAAETTATTAAAGETTTTTAAAGETTTTTAAAGETTTTTAASGETTTTTAASGETTTTTEEVTAGII